MKRMALVCLLICSLWALANEPPNPADYPLSVHVSSSRVNSRGSIRLKVVIDGTKYELEGIDAENSLLTPGDYKARMVPVKVKDVHAYDVYRNYEFLFPDGKTRKYNVVGILE